MYSLSILAKLPFVSAAFVYIVVPPAARAGSSESDGAVLKVTLVVDL